MALDEYLFNPLPDLAPPEQYRGGLAITATKSLSLQSLFKTALQRHSEIKPTPQPPHITLLTKTELRSLQSSLLPSSWGNVPTNKIYPLGAVKKGDVAFVPILWLAGNKWRVEKGLGWKAFHMTLSEKDEHDVDFDKSFTALRYRGQTGNTRLMERNSAVGKEEGESGREGREMMAVAGVPMPCDIGIEILDHLFLDTGLRLFASSSILQLQLELLQGMLASYPHEERAWLRLAGLAFSQEWWKIAMLAYHKAYMTAAGDGCGKRKKFYVKKVATCGEYTEFGLVFTEEEMQSFLANLGLGSGIRAGVEGLIEPWVDSEFVQEVGEAAAGEGGGGSNGEMMMARSFAVETRVKYYLPVKTTTLPEEATGQNHKHTWYKMPRFFSWVVPLHLSAMSTPRRASDIDALSKCLRITHIITLTAESPLPESWFGAAAGIRNTFIPTANYFPPTVHQMDRVLHMILDEAMSGGRTLIHCGGGKGRAGTVLACYLALFGFGFAGSNSGASIHMAEREPPKFEAKKAMEMTRTLRPGSIETSHQEKFIEKYVSLAWKRYGQGQPLIGAGGEIEEPLGKPLLVEGDISSPDMLFLIGVQGSGKSTFTSLCKLRNENLVVVSPDGIIEEENSQGGSAAASRAAESMVSRFRKSPAGTTGDTKKVLILDRCSPTVQERRYWRSLVTCNTPKTAAVFFDIPVDICVARAESRGGHVTMPPWRARGAIESFSNMLEKPTIKKEGFDGVATVRGTDNVQELANKLFGEVKMKKFIRTRHLLDLGSATRDDLVIPQSDLERHYLSQPVIIEEKLDGANLGFSLSSTGEIQTQNRSHYVSPSDQAQFGPLTTWLATHGDVIKKILSVDSTLPQRYVLFGEWMVAVHSIEYTTLPDVFFAFDIYDRLTGKFWKREELEGRLAGSGIQLVPKLYEGVLEGEEMLRSFLELQSRFAKGKVEGIVVRFERSGERGKVVRGDFLPGGEAEGEVRHWSKNVMRRNGVVWRDEGGD